MSKELEAMKCQLKLDSLLLEMDVNLFILTQHVTAGQYEFVVEVNPIPPQPNAWARLYCGIFGSKLHQ